MNRQLKIFLAYIVGYTMVLSAFIVPLSLFSYTQRYVQVNENNATNGIFFTKTIDLKEFKKVGTGSGLFGTYDSYSRSDRHEAISVYKD